MRGLKREQGQFSIGADCRTLTGAWIETELGFRPPFRPLVAPSRVRGLKPGSQDKAACPCQSHPHGVRRMNSAVVFNDVCMVREVIILINGFKWLFIEYSFEEGFYVGEDAG